MICGVPKGRPRVSVRFTIGCIRCNRALLCILRATEHELVEQPPTEPEHNAHKELGEVVAHKRIIAGEIRPIHSKPLEPAPDPTENLAPLLLGQEESNDHYQHGAEEDYEGRGSQ